MTSGNVTEEFVHEDLGYISQNLLTKAAITMVLSQDVGSFPIIHEKKNLGNHSRGIR